MDFNFQKIVLVISIILLIVAMGFIATAIINQNHIVDFPPVISECPDYWSHNVEQNKCINDRELGEYIDNQKLNEFGINDSNYATMCSKKNMMENYKLSWDGITNNPKLDNCL
jgi:hypothetical protein|tara:strand:- start:580 stop:918 length:339 start_codon:yes stop_codon:yes gene_type:complete